MRSWRCRAATSATSSSPASSACRSRPSSSHPTAASTPRRGPSAFVGDAPYVNSSNESLDLNGITSVAEAKRLTNEWLEANGHGEATVTYKLRDWLFSRQRYWGEPFPIVYDTDGNPHGLPDSELPLVLPDTDSFSPRTFDPDDEITNPESPLDRLEWWTDVELDLGDGPQPYRRDTNVMPQWAGSCWYELRYLDPTNETSFVDPAVEQYWMGPQPEGHDGHEHPGGVDLYVGGVEHAVLHLLYARFWHKVLFDLGHVVVERAVPPVVQPGLHPGRRVQGRARASTSTPRRSWSATAGTSTTASPSPASGARWARA